MYLQKITESEILKLLEKTEEEQLRFFRTNNILQIRFVDVKKIGEDDECAFDIYESLADLAARLWWKAYRTNKNELDDAMDDVYKELNKEILNPYCTSEIVHREAKDFFLYEAEESPCIVASLIALRRAGVTEIIKPKMPKGKIKNHGVNTENKND